MGVHLKEALFIIKQFKNFLLKTGTSNVFDILLIFYKGSFWQLGNDISFFEISLKENVTDKSPRIFHSEMKVILAVISVIFTELQISIYFQDIEQMLKFDSSSLGFSLFQLILLSMEVKAR